MALFGKYSISVLTAAAVLAAAPLMAQQASASGEVRRVDQANGKVTIKHGAITALKLPAMTLVYLAEPASLLAGIQAGDKVQFTAVRKDGQYLVTAISK